jgi:hypothetical protein
MTKTSTLIPSSVLSTTVKSEPKAEEVQLPEFDEPSASSILNILNYSKSLQILKSDLVKTIELVHT